MGTTEKLPPGIEKLVNQIGAMSQVERILLYGSRARGDAASRSDYDIAIDAPGLEEKDWNKIYWLAEEAETLYKIDCVWLQNISEDFKFNILRDAKVLVKK